MLYKVVKVEDRFEYDGKGHFNCQATRLHTNTDFEGGKLTMGVTHFLPNGGAEIRPAAFEMIYYCLSGQITIPIGNDNTEHVLNPGDSIRFMPGAERGIKITSHECADMLVVMIVE